jgi:hypothetical protein
MFSDSKLYAAKKTTYFVLRWNAFPNIVTVARSSLKQTASGILKF